MSTVEVVYPYAVVDNLELHVSSFTDGATGDALVNVITQTVDEVGQQRHDLVEARPRWAELQFDVSFTLSAEALAQVLPDPSAAARETVGLVSVRCASTKLRRGVRLRHAAGGTWRGTVGIARDDVYGLVELLPSLVRTTDLPEGGDEHFANFAGAVLAAGNSVAVVVDRAAKRFDGSMEYVWENFASSDDPWRASRRDDVFHLEPSETPRLFLNLRWGFLKPLLEYEGRTGASAAMRDMAAASIAQGAWTQLFMTAIASIVEDDEGHDVSGDAWRRDLATALAAELYPDVPASDRLDLAYQEWHDPSSIGVIVQKLGAYAQNRATLGKLLDRATKAMESVATLAAE
jgi:hypothetical protein